MKKTLSLILTLGILLLCAALPAALAEETDPKAQEAEAVLTYITQDIPEEDAEQILTWDRDTVLEKMESYPEALTYNTKEEIADQFLAMTELFNYFAGLAEDESGEAILGFLGDLMEDLDFGDAPIWVFDFTVWETEDQVMMISPEGDQYRVNISLVDQELTYLCDYQAQEEEDTVYHCLVATSTGDAETDQTQPDHGIAAFVYEPESDVIVKTDESGELEVFTHVIEETGTVVIDTFDGTIWESGDLEMTSVYQDGYYKVAITDGDTELSYLCEYSEDEPTWNPILNAIGTGDAELDETQADHGIATFTLTDEGDLVWQKADGTEAVFTQIIDPLTLDTWYSDNKELHIHWWGDLNYDVQIDDWMEGAAWHYSCVLDPENDTLSGTGVKELYGETDYTDANVTFVFGEDRDILTWTDDQEAQANGLTFERVEPAFTRSSWEGGDVNMVIGYFWAGSYSMSVYLNDDTQYSYVCSYDREKKLLTAADPATLNPEEYGDFENYRSAGSFQLVDEDHLLWRDDSGAAGENGTLLDRMF